MKDMVGNMFCMTTDSGTEHKIRTSKVKVSTLFPWWVSNGQVAPFATDLGIQLEEDSGDAIQDVEIDFTHMFGIRGSMRLMDTVQKELLKCFNEWSTAKGFLNVLCLNFGNPDSLK